MHLQENAMGKEVYARGLVDAALKSKAGKWLWRGDKVWLVLVAS